MGYETIVFENRDGVGYIKMNRPKSMNALEDQLLQELKDVTKAVAEDDQIKAVILTGSGNAFCAGGDLKRLQEGFTAISGMEYMKAIHPWVIQFANLNKPTIAAVNGFAVGAGFCISLLCDIVIASDQAKFGQAFVNVGLVPDLAGMYYLPRLVGLQRAKELVFTGRMVDAQEAYNMGIVNKITPADKLEEEVSKFAAKLAAGPTVAISNAKRIINMSINLNLEDLLEIEGYSQSLCFQTEDHKEAVDAFLSKRKPAFKGK